MSTPLVSIITPCYNSQAFLKETISSVIAQTYKNWELLLIDDGSSDKTQEIISEFSSKDSRIKFVKNKRNLGVAETRNHGLALAQGTLVAFLDSDDLWMTYKLEKQVSAFLNGLGNFIFSDYEYIDEDGNYLRTYYCPHNISRKNLLKGSFIGCLSVLVSKELIGDSRFKKTFHEDYILWLELMNKPSSIPIAIYQPLARYRNRKNSLSANKLKCAQKQWMIYRKELNFSLLKSFYYFGCYFLKSLLKHYI